ncbi:1-phosphofructokinase family hexose kinase [Actinoplanes friuliensis]|uniref:1-phosphofructokinase n=1 Tax=Actinoplanes friuliensis DSM 7358 TaxID=1246995 RepID=U5W0V3_9ACTN|nr:PfkB family carbohydrate kinase [Actinoplanes friuliensis]AGZ42769.1 1-phosphofructokinase [Actinoplanes friuliensis DSM 7358]
MIVTVTLNPALDLTYRVGTLVPHGTHRVSQVAERPGGKGLNVAGVLHALGEPVLATGLLGGTTGGRVTTLLAGDAVPAAFVRIAGETRRTVAVADDVDATGFWEPGPQVTPGEWAAFVAHFRDLLGTADVVALSGSLPPGVPVDAYATLVHLAAEYAVPSILDTSGEALRHGLAARPDLAKPNTTELSALLASASVPGGAAITAGRDRTFADAAPGRAGTDAGPSGARDADAGPALLEARGGGRELADAARALELGARAVVVSQGPDGLLALTVDEAWRGVPSERLEGNPTGAGDACVAALARGLRDRTPWPALLADAVALSAAAVAAPVAGAVDAATYRRLLPAVRVSAA